METTVVINDLQMPFHDRLVLALILDFISRIDPDRVILNGDIVDCYTISNYATNPMRPEDLEAEIQLAGILMSRLAGVPEKIWIGGNHEDRLRRYIWSKARELGHLTSLDFPVLFDLEQYGFQWYPYGQHVRLGKLLVTHGSIVRNHSGASGRAHFEKYGVSTLIGHTHRLGIYYKTQLGSPHAAYENGCLCNLEPEYVSDPDWQQGFCIVRHDPQSGLFCVEQIPVFRSNGVPTFMYQGELVEGQ